MLIEVAESTAAVIQQAIFEKDVRKLKGHIEEYLIQTISVHDSASEAFYQGLMIGLCAILNNRYSVKSNRESGLGRFDIQLKPIDTDLPGFIFELKTTKAVSKDDNKSLIENAGMLLNDDELEMVSGGGQIRIIEESGKGRIYDG